MEVEPTWMLPVSEKDQSKINQFPAGCPCWYDAQGNCPTVIKLLMARRFQSSTVIFVRNDLPYDVFDIPGNKDLSFWKLNYFSLYLLLQDVISHHRAGYLLIPGQEIKLIRPRESKGIIDLIPGKYKELSEESENETKVHK